MSEKLHGPGGIQGRMFSGPIRRKITTTTTKSFKTYDVSLCVCVFINECEEPDRELWPNSSGQEGNPGCSLLAREAANIRSTVLMRRSPQVIEKRQSKLPLLVSGTQLPASSDGAEISWAIL